MPIDAYDPCPCGSGKKLKFCCHAVAGEMSKISKLQENNQSRMALQALDNLEKSHPGNLWIRTTRAAILFDDQRPEEAKPILKQLLEEHPDHVFAIGMYAMAAFAVDGYEPAKAAIHRAFQKCSRDYPELVSGIALGIAALMHGRGRFLSARQHLTLAMRLAAEEDRQQVFLRLLEFDSSGEIPYPLRSVHELADYSGSEESEKESRKAQKLSDIGSWDAASRVYARLAEQDPNNADLWYNNGLCRAWDGDENGAAEALHRAAQLQGSYETAIEWETLAQLLDLNTTEDCLRFRRSRFRVKSVGRLLTLLGRHERIERSDFTPPPEEAEEYPEGVFRVLDRTPLTGRLEADIPLESIPTIVGEVLVYGPNANQGDQPEAVIVAREGGDYDTMHALLHEIAGDEVEAIPPADKDDDVTESVPNEMAGLNQQWLLPSSAPIKVRRHIRHRGYDQFLNETWPHTALAALGGKTPTEAAGDAELKTRLAAAIYVLDAYCDMRRVALDVDAVFQQLQTAPLAPLEVRDDTPLHTLSAMQLHRLPVQELTDVQLSYTLKRALLIHQGAFLYRVLTEILSRPSCKEAVDLERVYMTLVDLTHEQDRHEEALKWVLEARDHARTGENAFENVLKWEMRELSLRMEDPDDPALRPLLQRFWDYYGAKVPQLRDYVAQICQMVGIPVPGDAQGDAFGAMGGTSTPSGVWTPEGAGAGQGEKKLWVPGQD